MLTSGSGQKPYSSDTYDGIPRVLEPQQGYNMRDSEQMNLGIRNQAEYMNRNEIHFNESSNRNVGIIYTPSSAYRDVKTPMWVSKNVNEQTTIDIINKVNNKVKN